MLISKDLAPRDLAKVATKLQVPLIVSDILNGGEEIADETEYALHEAISEMQPDSALLCIALCGSKIAGMENSTPALILEMECRRIIEEYATLWLRNAEGNDIDADQAFEALSSTQEDLEDLAGLFDNCVVSLEKKSKDAAMLCNIMRIQARAQALVAEAYFETLEAQTIDPVIIEHVAADNVIPFPKRV